MKKNKTVEEIMEDLNKAKRDLEDINSMVDHPQHYNNGGIECIDAMISAYGKESVAHFCLISAFKYIWRCQHKNALVEDIDKAIWYLNKYKELV